MVFVGNVEIPVFELLLIMAPIIYFLYYFYNKSLKKSDAVAIYVYANGTADKYPCIEVLGEHKITVKISKKETKDFAIDGLPLEIRLGAVKRERTYYIKDGSPKTWDSRILTQTQPIDIMDTTTEIFYDSMSKIKSFTSALASAVFDRFTYHLPWLIAGFGGGVGITFLIISILG